MLLLHLLTNTRERASEASERAKRASAPETHIFMPQKSDISVWPIATTIILNTIYIILVVLYKVHFIYQISEVLFDMHK